jgi:hypothetical protein
MWGSRAKHVAGQEATFSHLRPAAAFFDGAGKHLWKLRQQTHGVELEIASVIRRIKINWSKRDQRRRRISICSSCLNVIIPLQSPASKLSHAAVKVAKKEKPRERRSRSAAFRHR